MRSIEDLYLRYELLAAAADELLDFAVAKGTPRPAVLDLLAAGDPASALAAWAEAVTGLSRTLATGAGDPYLVASARILGGCCAHAVLRCAAWEELAVAEQYRRGPAAGMDDPGGLPELCERLVSLAEPPPAKLFLIWGIADAVYRKRTPVVKQRPVE